jgi:hypothetical protein
MQGPTKPPTFDPRDWAQFDFSRWHLDGLPVEAVPVAVADLAQRLFGSEEWRQHFQATLPAVQRAVLDAYREHARHLEEEKTAAGRDFDERIAAARIRSEEFGQAIAAAGSPPVVEPDPQTYHLGVRVTATKEAHLGLAGLVVQVTGPRDKTPLAQGLTDRDGNALLAIPVTKAGDSTKSDATLEILTADAKSLRLQDAKKYRPNRRRRKSSPQDSADITALKSAALDLRSQREASARELVASIDRLRQERDARLQYLDQQLHDVRATIDQLEEPGSNPPPADAQKDPTGPAAERPDQPTGPPAGRARRSSRPRA